MSLKLVVLFSFFFINLVLYVTQMHIREKNYTNMPLAQSQDMSIEDPEIVELVKQIEELERKLYAHPLHKV